MVPRAHIKLAVEVRVDLRAIHVARLVHVQVLEILAPLWPVVRAGAEHRRGQDHTHHLDRSPSHPPPACLRSARAVPPPHARSSTACTLAHHRLATERDRERQSVVQPANHKLRRAGARERERERERERH